MNRNTSAVVVYAYCIVTVALAQDRPQALVNLARYRANLRTGYIECSLTDFGIKPSAGREHWFRYATARFANDDIIYRQPFVFPNGAPRLWHHSGNRALGLKHNGRWVVFYHQGDIYDAWKTGHSGASENQ